MANLKLTLAYDGTDFLGWQQTKEGLSVEETLTIVLEQILQEKITLQAASRTDAGVHADGQVVNFFTQKETLDLLKLKLSLNQLLPKNIAILNAERVNENFHPTLDVIQKEYHYFICNSEVQHPKNRLYSWYYPYKLNISDMEKASYYLIGEHDFSAFCNVKKNATYKDFIRKVDEIQIELLPEMRMQIKILGNHFLYKMVRNIVGTLVYVGNGKIKLEEIPLLLQGKDRKKTGMTAPSHGLFLHKICY